MRLVFIAATVTRIVFIPREGVWVLESITEYHQTGSTSGTLTVTVETGTTAPGSGTAQLTAVISLAAATQQILQNGTLIASPTEIGPGNRASMLIAGTMTSLANGGAVISFRRIR